MKTTIIYHAVEGFGGLFDFPKETHREVVEHSDSNALNLHIIHKLDDWGNKFEKASARDKKTFGFDYISRTGGIKVETYKPPKIKKI